jgi:hypothetical protein
MNAKLIVATAVMSLSMATPAQAQMTEEQLIDHAIAQAKAAGEATTMARAKAILRRASNCLIGRDSGYFFVGAGGPCNSRINVTTATTDAFKREQITNAFNKLLAASGKADLQEAQDYAEDAVAMLEEAKDAGDGGE